MTEILALFANPANWPAIAALVAMEVVLGIDNLIFISVLTNKLPEAIRGRARQVGIGLALILRLVLLSLIAFIVTLTTPLFHVGDHGLSWRDLILIAGGLFLVWKATKEIHHNVEHGGAEGGEAVAVAAASAPAEAAETDGEAQAEANGAPGVDAGASVAAVGFGAAIVQIVLLDLVFSIDSIVTAVGMTDHVPIMFLAVIVAVAAMALAAGPLSRFIERNPTVVMLALAFLFMIGMTLIADGLGHHVPKGYIYAAMGFSALVEALNILARRRREKARATH